MKIVLAALNAKYIHANPAVYILKACAEDICRHIEIREFTINQPRDQILRGLSEGNPDVICVSCYIWNISLVEDIFADLAKVLPGTALWAGGPEVSYDAEKFLAKHPFFKGVMTGEGEETFRELVAAYMHSRYPALNGIAGTAVREGNRIYRQSRSACTDMDSIPFIYRELKDFENRIIYYESSRGCPFSCSYCLSSIDRKVRFRSDALVENELLFFLEKKVPQVKFVDRTFNCSHGHAMKIWRFLIEHDNGVTNFHFEIAADLLNEEELSLLSRARPGLIQLEIGVQSTNPETIREICRVMDFEKTALAVEKIRSFGNIHQHLDLIAGLPFEDYESFHRSFNDVYALKPDQLQLGFLKVLKGSPMCRKIDAYGLHVQTNAPYEVLSTRWLSFTDIAKLKRVEEMVELYYNSGQFCDTLHYLALIFDDAFLFYEKLGDYYREKKYGTMSSSRLRRYEILLEFLQQIPGIKQEELIDHLMTDLYLRENLKSRPSFAPSREEYLGGIRDYLRKNKLTGKAHIEVLHDGRRLLFDYRKRNPKNHNAFMKELKEEKENELV